MGQASSGMGVHREIIRMREMRTNESQGRLSERYEQLSSDQKRVFDSVMIAFYRTINEHMTETHGKSFVIQVGEGWVIRLH